MSCGTFDRKRVHVVKEEDDKTAGAAGERDRVGAESNARVPDLEMSLVGSLQKLETVVRGVRFCEA